MQKQRSSKLHSFMIGVSALLVTIVSISEARAEQGSPGIVVEKLRATQPSSTGVGDGIITIVRVDPARYAFRFLSENHDGPRRPLPSWVRDFNLTGGINAGMFMPDGRSVGYMKAGGAVRSNRRPSNHKGVIAFDPIGSNPAIGIGGEQCSRGLPWLDGRYGSVLQTRTLLIDCEGRPVDWRTRRFSAAAFGVDDQGWAVFVHSRTPYHMHILARMLTTAKTRIRGLAYMEGGPEASLVVKTSSGVISHMGSWEDGFNPNDDNHAFWDLPNIIGFSKRN